MSIKRILVPTDFGPASMAALDCARDLAEATGAQLFLLHIVDELTARYLELPMAMLGEVQTSLEDSARQQLDELARRHDLQFSTPDAAVLTAKAPADAIVGYAQDEQVDLIVMGTHGRAPVVRMFLGSVADRVVRTAACPVLTVRQAKRLDTGDGLREAEIQESEAAAHPPGSLTSR